MVAPEFYVEKHLEKHLLSKHIFGESQRFENQS